MHDTASFLRWKRRKDIETRVQELVEVPSLPQQQFAIFNQEKRAKKKES